MLTRQLLLLGEDMERKDLLLRLTCAVASIEREGHVETLEALTNMIIDLAACDAKLGSDPAIREIRFSIANVNTLTVQ